MGLTKQYLRYVPGGSFNIVSSSNCNIEHVIIKGVSGRFLAAAACEHVVVWDMRLGEKAQIFQGEKAEVTRLAASSATNRIAVGYIDGNINVFDLESCEVTCVFAGHKAPITALSFDENGHRLASGSKDTDVIIWDVVAESGYARLSGHRGVVTSVTFINSRNCIVSSSKDTYIKFWDLETKHCFKTLGGHRTEIWSCILMKSERYLVTGCIDHQLKVWKMKWKDSNDDQVEKLTKSLEIAKIEDSEDAIEENNVLQCHLAGTLVRGGKGRVVELNSDSDGAVLSCFGTDSLLELFSFCDDDEANTRMVKRIKKHRKKLSKHTSEGTEPKTEDDCVADLPNVLTLTDEVRRINSITVASKIKGVTLVSGTGGELRCGISLADNSLHLYSTNADEQNAEFRTLRQIYQLGHRSDAKCVAFSSDNLAIISASSDSIKLWNRPSQTCLRTVDTVGARVLSICFAPGDRHALAGCADGRLLIVDIAAGDILEEVKAHTDQLWAIGLMPDLRGCYSGGGDKTVKLWQFDLIADPTEQTNAKVLSLLHLRTLKLDESVLAVRISPNEKFIAVALMDSTVKIFFLDSFKFYLSLYGHKLPVLCLDISYDSSLIVTGSADRNIKIWGMDFGDCHKSLFAHDDSVTAVQFVQRTHYFFSCGRDGKVKEWDADSYDNIIVLQGHVGACWNLSVASAGLFVVSCGADRALRLWSRSDEPLVLGDTDEADEGLATGDRAPVPGLPNLNIPTKKTIGSEKAADSILECLEIGAEFREQQKNSSKPIQPPPLMQVYQCDTPEDFLLEAIKRIRSSDLEEALMILPFKTACEMVTMLAKLLDRTDHTELLCRLAVFLLKIHHAAIVSNHSLLKDVIHIQAKAMMRMNELRDTVGYNLYALQWLNRDIEETQGEVLFKEAIELRKTKNRTRRKREALKRPLIVLT